MQQMIASAEHTSLLNLVFQHLNVLVKAVSDSQIDDHPKLPALFNVLQKCLEARCNGESSTAAESSASVNTKKRILILAKHKVMLAPLSAALSSRCHCDSNAAAKPPPLLDSVLLIDSDTRSEYPFEQMSNGEHTIIVAFVDFVYLSADFPWACIDNVICFDSLPDQPPMPYVTELVTSKLLVIHELRASETDDGLHTGETPFPSITLMADAAFLAKNGALCSMLPNVSFLQRSLGSTPIPVASASAAASTPPSGLSGADVILDERTCIVVRSATSMVQQMAFDVNGAVSASFAVDTLVDELAVMSLKYERCHLLINAYDVAASNNGTLGTLDSDSQKHPLMSPHFMHAQLRLAASLSAPKFPIQVDVRYIASAQSFAAVFMEICTRLRVRRLLGTTVWRNGAAEDG